MILEGLIALIVGASALISAVQELLRLDWGRIAAWFSKYVAKFMASLRALHQTVHTGKESKEFLFTLLQRMKDGKFHTVCGVFDEDTETVVEAEQFQSGEVDEELTDTHQGKELVIYGSPTGA